KIETVARWRRSARQTARGIPFRAAYETDSRAAVARGAREFHGTAFRRAHAHFCRQDSTRRGFGLWHVDGRGGGRSDVRRAGSGDAPAITRTGKRRGFCGHRPWYFVDAVQRV